MLTNSKQQKIYWEKQGQDKLCGVHCLNSLLQGPYCNEIELSNQALELDKQERELMAQGGQTNDYKQFLKEASNNVAEDGNFSFQVLSEALKKLGDLYMESVDSKINLLQDLSNEMGFICNSSSHWFPIRKIDGIWYNLNSTNRGGPEIISDFYLSAFLQSIKENGYTIFVVKGVYPMQEDPVEFFGEFSKHQKWFTKAQVQVVHQKRLKNKNYKLNIGGTDEREYDEAIKRSMGTSKKQNMMESEEEDWEQFENPEQEQAQPEKKQENVAFSGTGIQIEQGESSEVNYYKFDLNSNEDPELAFALKLSIEGKFQELVKNGIAVAFAMPEGKQIHWVFSPDSLIEDLYDYVLINLPPGKSYSYTLQTNFPKHILCDTTLTLEQAGIEDMTQIVVAKK